MKPWKIALFILLVMGGLLLATLFSSRVVLEGMRSEDGFSVGGSMIKYPTIETFWVIIMKWLQRLMCVLIPSLPW